MRHRRSSQGTTQLPRTRNHWCPLNLAALNLRLSVELLWVSPSTYAESSDGFSGFGSSQAELEVDLHIVLLLLFVLFYPVLYARRLTLFTPRMLPKF